MNLGSKSLIHASSRFANKKNSKLLLIPFISLTLLLVIIPLILILVKSFLPTSGSTVQDNLILFYDSFIWKKILLSVFVALITTIVCIIISYPFCYFLSTSKSKIFKTMIIFIATAPVWTSFLVKLVGLKTFFDICAGHDQSTFGNIWTIIGLIYLYLPFMIMPLYSVLNGMPHNLILASYDLGYGVMKTFFRVTLPYTKTALISGVTLVFLPALTTVAVPQFLNNNNDGSLIGDIIISQGGDGLANDVSMARASALSLMLSLLLLASFGIYVITKKIIRRRGKKRKYA